MRRAVLAVTAALIATFPASAQVAAPSAPVPIVVELFTAQGCRACPEANAVVGRLADHAGVLVLTWPVDYWDYLGWKDTLAKPEFAVRQRGYRTRLRLLDVYTPQVIVNGRGEAPGHRPRRVQRLIDRSPARSGPVVAIERGGGRAIVGGGPTPLGGAEAWLVRYDPRVLLVRVRRGETAGMAVPHRNVVRELVRLGSWTGPSRSYDLPPPSTPGLRSVVLIQGARQGVLAVGD